MKAELKLWIDANVWDGEDRSGAKGDSACFNPDDLMELISNLYDDVIESEIEQLKAKVAELEKPKGDIDDQLKAAGMLTVSELMNGGPIDGFIAHAGVADLNTFRQWLEMRTREIKEMQAKLHLKKREETELFEWVVAHNAAFNEVWVNFNIILK